MKLDPSDDSCFPIRGFAMGYSLGGERINDAYGICQSSNSSPSISRLPCNTLKLLYCFALL